MIDIHVHADPDSVARSIDAIDLARLAKARGMRGMVLKSHYEPTASMAYLVKGVLPDHVSLGFARNAFLCREFVLSLFCGTQRIDSCFT